MTTGYWKDWKPCRMRPPQRNSGTALQTTIGVRHGCRLSQTIFNTFLENIMAETWDDFASEVWVSSVTYKELTTLIENGVQAYDMDMWRRNGSAVECRTLDRENAVTNPLHISAIDGDSLWRCYVTTKQNHCTCTLQ